MNIKVGVGLPNVIRNVDPGRIAQWARTAERASLSSVASFGRFGYPGVSDTVTLTAAAAVTETIGLISAVVVAPAWPPALLAKEIAGIAGIAAGRLSVGFGVGVREDDFVVRDLGLAGRGARLDRDLVTYRNIWSGAPVDGGAEPVITAKTPDIPLLFGGMSPPALAKMAAWGKGYIAPALPAALAAPHLVAARIAWTGAGREGHPYLVAIAYFGFGLGDHAAAHAYIADYYAATPEFVDVVASGVATTPQQVLDIRDQYAELGVDELVFCPTSDDLNELTRLIETLR